MSLPLGKLELKPECYFCVEHVGVVSMARWERTCCPPSYTLVLKRCPKGMHLRYDTSILTGDTTNTFREH